MFGKQNKSDLMIFDVPPRVFTDQKTGQETVIPVSDNDIKYLIDYPEEFRTPVNPDELTAKAKAHRRKHGNRSRRDINMRRLVIPAACVVALVAAAPYIGQASDTPDDNATTPTSNNDKFLTSSHKIAALGNNHSDNARAKALCENYTPSTSQVRFNIT